MTNQTLLGIGALALLMTILLNFYSALGRAGVPLDDAQFVISATSLGISFMEYAHGLAFDEVTEGEYITNPNQLTHPMNLGPDAKPDSLPQETSMRYYNDFDDFLGDTIDTDMGELGIFRTTFDVYYVNPDDVTQRINQRSFTKRMDLRIWRLDVPQGSDVDTLRMFTVHGYFNFN